MIFLFLRDVRATLIPSAVIPLSLLAAAAVMLALQLQPRQPVADGADHRGRLRGRRRHRHGGGDLATDRARRDSRSRRRWRARGEIGFTILSISISLIAVFTPLMFMGGVVGRLMREFALTLSAAVLVSLAAVADADADAVRPVPAGARSRPATRFTAWRWSAASPAWRRSYARGARRGAARTSGSPSRCSWRPMALRGLPLRDRADRLLPAAGHRLPPGRDA